MKKNPSAQELEDLNNNRTKINLRNLVGQKQTTTHLDSSAKPSEDLYNYEARSKGKSGAGATGNGKATLGPSSHTPGGTEGLMVSIPRSQEDSNADMEKEIDRKQSFIYHDSIETAA